MIRGLTLVRVDLKNVAGLEGALVFLIFQERPSRSFEIRPVGDLGGLPRQSFTAYDRAVPLSD